MTIRCLWFPIVCSFAAAGLALADSKPDAQRRVSPLTAKEIRQGFRDVTLIAKPKAGVTETALHQAETGCGAAAEATFPRLDAVRVIGVSGETTADVIIERLRASGLYDYVEPDYVKSRHAVPNDPRFSEQWALRNTGQDGGKAGSDIGAISAWDTRTNADEMIIAVIDTGIRVTHEDLADNLWRNPGEVAGNGKDDDGNGYVDDVHGINVLVAKGSALSGNPDDDHGHGTSVSGMAAAVGNNGKGTAGVAWKAKIMALKFDDAASSASNSRMVECIDYAIAKGAKVINISYGSSGSSQAEYDAIKRARDAGVIVVTSAGNDGASAEIVANYPAGYLLDNLVTVANSTRHDVLSATSTYGSIVDLAAPGTDVLTTSNKSDTEYRFADGTSLAAPVVAGAAALVRAQYPSESYRQIINRVLGSTDILPGLSGRVLTGGRLNLAKALTTSSNRPFNDAFASRATLSGSGLYVRTNNSGATAEASEPAHAGAPGGASVWWSWTASEAGTIVLDTQGSSFDTVLAVYSGASVGALTSIASNDDSSSGKTSRVTFEATANTTYHFAIDGRGGATGSIVLNLGIVPKNDAFANAITVAATNTLVSGTNFQASKEAGEPTINRTYTGTGKSVWYKWTAPKSGRFAVVPHTQSFLPLTGVYTGNSVGELQTVDTGLYSSDFTATAGVTYYIQVDSGDGATGRFGLIVIEAYYAVKLGAAINSSPVLTKEGHMVFTDENGFLVYVTDSSNTTWTTSVKGEVEVNTPALGQNGYIYLSTTSGLFAYDSSGALKWEKTLTADLGSSPSVAADGTVYQHAGDGKLYAFRSDGSEKWQRAIPGQSYSSPSIGPDGTIFIGSDDHYLYAIAPSDGSVKWRFDAGDEIFGSAAVGADGSVYFGAMNGKFYALDGNGSQRWVYSAGGDISSSPALAPDGTIYFGCYDGKLYALTSAGGLKWVYSTDGEIRGSSPAVAADGTIYIGSYDSRLHAVTSNGTRRWVCLTNGIVRSSPLVARGGILVGSADEYLYVIPENTDVANSPWPMHRQNASRTGRKAPATAPSIHAQPSSRTVAIGGSVTLSVSAEGQDTLSFQWYLNGVAIPGANQSTYTITNASDASAGNYTVVVTNSLGSATSSVATVKVATASDLGRIINLSARAVAGADAKTLIVGLVVRGGSGPKDLLIRGVGPELASRFSVPGALADPKLTFFNSAGVSLTTNDNWGGDAAIADLHSRVGAFAYSSTSSKDAALSTSVSSGAYTAHVSSATGSGSGVALAEFYDATQVFTSDTPRLVNISARSEVGRNADVLIVGFVIGGSTSRTVLIRAVGPELATRFNLAGVLADPKVELRNSSQELIQQNDNWSSGTNAAELKTTMAQAGAFELANGSKDAAILVTLQPGAYTAVVSGVNDTTGIALAEVYEIE